MPRAFPCASLLFLALVPPAAAGPAYQAGTFQVAGSRSSFVVGTSTVGVLDPQLQAVFTSSTGIRLGQSALGVGPKTVALWHFDDMAGRQVSDSTLNNHSGTSVCLDTVQCASPTVNSGSLFNGCLTFNNTDQAVIVSPSTDFSPTVSRNQFTFEAWLQVNPLTTDDHQSIIDKAGEWGLFARANGKLTFQTNGVDRLTSQATPFPSNGWLFVAAVWDHAGSTTALYLNGVLDSSTNVVDVFSNNSKDLSFGLPPDFSQPGFQGLLDDVRISSYALTADEIAADYVSGALKYSTDGGATWSYMLDPTQIAFTTSSVGAGVIEATVSYSTSAVFQDCSANNLVEMLVQDDFAQTGQSPALNVWVTTTPPAAPGPFTVAARHPNDMTWTWPAECGASYLVFASTIPNGAPQAMGTVGASSFTLSGILPDEPYVFVATPTNAAGAGPPAVAVDTSAAFPPTATTLVAVSSESVIINWSADGNPSDTIYDIWRGTDPVNPSPTPRVQTTTRTLVGLIPQSIEYFKVRAINKGNIPTAFDVQVSTQMLPDFLATTPFFNNGPFYPHDQLMHLQGLLDGTSMAFELDVPANAFAQDYYIHIATTLATTPQCGVTANAVQILITPAQQPVLPSSFTFAYDPTTLPLSYQNHPERLVVQRYDGPTGRCIPLVTNDDVPLLFPHLGALTHTLGAEVDHFSVLQISLAAAGPTDLDSARAWPNPLYLSRGGEAYFTFDNLPDHTSIRVYTLRGELLYEGFADVSGHGQWNATNSYGTQVASGVYLVHLQNGSNGRTLKVAVER